MESLVHSQMSWSLQMPLWCLLGSTTHAQCTTRHCPPMGPGLGPEKSPQPSHSRPRVPPVSFVRPKLKIQSNPIQSNPSPLAAFQYQCAAVIDHASQTNRRLSSRPLFPILAQPVAALTLRDTFARSLTLIFISPKLTHSDRPSPLVLFCSSRHSHISQRPSVACADLIHSLDHRGLIKGSVLITSPCTNTQRPRSPDPSHSGITSSWNTRSLTLFCRHLAIVALFVQRCSRLRTLF